MCQLYSLTWYVYLKLIVVQPSSGAVFVILLVQFFNCIFASPETLPYLWSLYLPFSMALEKTCNKSKLSVAALFNFKWPFCFSFLLIFVWLRPVSFSLWNDGSILEAASLLRMHDPVLEPIFLLFPCIWLKRAKLLTRRCWSFASCLNKYKRWV